MLQDAPASRGHHRLDGGGRARHLIGAAAEFGCKNALVMWPVRIAVSGEAVTPDGAVEICHILGRTETLARIDKGIEKLEK